MDTTYKSILESLPSPIMIHIKGRLLYANRASSALLGFEKPEDLMSLKSIAYALKKECMSNSISFYNKEGETIDCSLKHFPINFQGFAADGIIIEQIEKQTFINNKAQENKQNEAIQSRTRFLAAISHEMRTPLNSLINLSHLLKNTELDKNQIELVEIAHHSAQELLDRIEDVLEFSQLESEKIAPNLSPINVANEIYPVIEILENSALNKNINFNYNINPKCDTQFMGCATSLRRVIRHIGENAIKYTYEGSVEINVDINNVQNGINIEIKDTGLGINPQKLKEIFDPFSFNINPINRIEGGLCLGLALSKAITNMHGGELKLENNSPQGIIAKIFLPFEIIAIEKEGNEENLKQKEPSLNILVAEDNMTNQKVITLILNQLGHEVTTASDGSLCIETLGTQNFDLILMDLHMPYMDGYEATRRIRAAGNEIPIFALTADARNEAREQALEVGMDGFLTKPLMVGELHALLCAIIDYKLENEQRNAA